MRVLLALVHYFRGEESAPYSSTKLEYRERRAEAVRSVIDSWRGHLGPATLKNHQLHRLEVQRGMGDTLDIVAIVNGDNHLLDRDYCLSRQVETMNVTLENPRMLGFAAQKLFSDTRYAYDMYVFSEDDLRPVDGGLLPSVMGFQEEFGWRRLLLPNRYEWNTNGHTLKTFIDGDVYPEWLTKYMEALPDEEFLHQRLPGRTVSYRRAANPHSGFFAITAEQLAHWVRQPHYGDQDCSFESPLASAATLGMLKTFPIYKAFGRDMGWFEIQHLDTIFSDKSIKR